ncbi:Com family DNA-binding transcriptional regulator [Rhodobacteraceae bacterium M382]|nr:Com family DNA-binding transcriptional regulator [Rhodobacteraceae bacterium M382]
MKHEQRCGRCRRLLLKMEENALCGALEIKCPRCGTLTELRPPKSPSPQRQDRDGELGSDAQVHRDTTTTFTK